MAGGGKLIRPMPREPRDGARMRGRLESRRVVWYASFHAPRGCHRVIVWPSRVVQTTASLTWGVVDSAPCARCKENLRYGSLRGEEYGSFGMPGAPVRHDLTECRVSGSEGTLQRGFKVQGGEATAVRSGRIETARDASRRGLT